MSKALDELREVRRQALADGMVKVGLPMTDDPDGRERCFGKRLSATHARLDNVPVFCDGVHFGDVVEFREQDPPDELLKEFVRVVTRGSGTAVVPYCDGDVPRPKDELQSLFSQARDRLMALPEPIRPLAVEGVMPGWLALALPVGLSRPQFEQVMGAIPEQQTEESPWGSNVPHGEAE